MSSAAFVIPMRGPVAIGAGLSGTDLALHPDFARNHLVYISYTKPLDPPAGAAPPAAPEAGRGGRGAAPRTTVAVAVAASVTVRATV